MTPKARPYRPTREEIRALLSGLPHPEPPPGLSDAVMARVHREGRRRRRIRRIPWLAAACVLLASALFLVPGDQAEVPARVAEMVPGGEAGAGALSRSAERVEFEAIRADYRRLADDMELLRQFVAELPGNGSGAGPSGPLVRIGGSDQLDLFLDLRPFFELPPSATPTPAVIPAADRR